MTASPLYVGIDLGTTNSAAAVFDGSRLDLVRNPQGVAVTPSVVRIDARGNVTVGVRARKLLDQDPENVRTEFKRLMGTPHALRFPAAGQEKRPEELSAEVLRAIREDVRVQTGVMPTRAVISVPALFELPQTSATSEAARLAGFERVEMIQEPVASAIAAGWKADGAPGPWLVYDLGGGTFDVSLLETQDGLLRVVGHDGDNFLGGRDFDAAIVDWAIERLAAEQGVTLARASPAHAIALRRLRTAAEEAKIELTRAREAELALVLDVDGAKVDVALMLDRETLERLVEPLVMRSISVCARLLGTHGIVLGETALTRVVLVGGPTAMPMLRERVAAILGAPFGDGLDPMTLVAQGAALYAASAHLDAKAAPAAAAATGAAKVWLQYPAVSSDVTPFVVGKLIDAADRARVASVVVSRADGSWSSAPEALDAEGTFAVMVSLAPRVPTELRIEGRAPGEAATPVPLAPSRFTIVHGVTIGDPPLARSVGVALANDGVHVFFERGSPLPMRRSFGLRTVEALAPQSPDGCLRVPIVQGEFPLAHLCRLVGTLEIPARELRAPLAAGAQIEVTIEMDRGGRVAASARVVSTEQVFDRVAHLVAGQVPVDELGGRLADLARRLQTVRAKAFQHAQPKIVEKLATTDTFIQQAARDEESARGGDLDSAEKVRRALVDLDAMLADAESALAWPDLDERARARVARATAWVAELGTPEERKVLAAATAALEKARIAKNAREVDRQVGVIDQLGSAASLRRPGAWDDQLDFIVGRAADTTDPRRASALVEEGRAASARGDAAGVERAVRGIWALLPPSQAARDLGHGSGVR